MRFLVAVVVYNENDRFLSVVEELEQISKKISFDLVIVDDGSTDGTLENYSSRLQDLNSNIIRHPTNLGVGAAIRSAIQYAFQQQMDAIIIMAGNGKMDAREIPRLMEPLEKNEADYVQGSRYLPGGSYSHMPVSRVLGIKLFTLISNILLGFRGTDVTCGFRAYKLGILKQLSIDIEDERLDHYELEFFIHYKVIKNGKKVVEVPVSMRYPASGLNYSKIRPGSGWWSMIRPWVYMRLGIWS